jgi:uncharacterized short protein YbdD (DUF466 family)
MWGKRGSRAAGQRGSRRRFATLLRQLAGMPDYQAHLEHLRRCHPGQAEPSEREYFEQFLKTRYGEGAARCC